VPAGLAGRHILLGITGSIAAYKTPDLVRRLRDAGAEITAVLTEAGARLVAPLALQAVTGRPTHLALFPPDPLGGADPETGAAMDHIALARAADLVLIAPASADFLARLRLGLADDLLTTLCLATQAPIAVAPAMNHAMWSHPATRGHCRALAARGVRILGPATGTQACGEEGPGRMWEPEEICANLADAFSPPLLTGLSCLVTAGPTREPLDPVRFLSNESSGKMGYAVAAAARAAGARVTLVSGPTALPAPAGVRFLSVTTAAEMLATVLAEVGTHQIFIAAAAVADYRLARPAVHKMKKGSEDLVLALEPTPDILKTVAGLAGAPFTVGFAAETEDLAANALKKLKAKGLDLVAANLVGPAVPGLGFGAEENALHLFWMGGERALPRQGKRPLATALVAAIAELYREKIG
jgi:phosphopantothenoylcysteine decarboxylase/phosphopantothenate--cysteine ligase